MNLGCGLTVYSKPYSYCKDCNLQSGFGFLLQLTVLIVRQSMTWRDVAGSRATGHSPPPAAGPLRMAEAAAPAAAPTRSSRAAALNRAAWDAGGAQSRAQVSLPLAPGQVSRLRATVRDCK